MSGVRVERGEKERRLATVVLDRPPLNILDLETLATLGERLEALAAEPGVQLVVVRGAGERAFSCGVAVQDHTPEKIPAMLETFHRAIRALARMPAVSLAVVDGHCLGGGLELAASCDLVLASEESRFGQPEIELGCFPPVAAALFPARLGSARTMELLLTGRTLDCAEAERLGLVNWSAPREKLEEKRREVVAALLAKSGAASRLVKRAVAAGRDLGFEAALAEAERLYVEELAGSEDAAEGVAAFLEKRKPRWKHK